MTYENHPTCCNGHDVDYKDEVFACDQKACSHEELCIGCVWQCADCSGDFCESHIVDLADVAGAQYTVFLCAACLLKRREAPAPKPAGRERFFDVAPNTKEAA